MAVWMHLFKKFIQEFLCLLGLFDPLCDMLHGTLDFQSFEGIYIKYSMTG